VLPLQTRSTKMGLTISQLNKPNVPGAIFRSIGLQPLLPVVASRSTGTRGSIGQPKDDNSLLSSDRIISAAIVG
jgi:hypothetical protein